jgi:hypothetical protein
MVFSTNQVRQFYVVKSKEDLEDVRALVAEAGYPDATNAGKTAVVVIDNYDNPASHDSHLGRAYELLYVNVDGEIMHSDIIKRDNIRSIKLTNAKDLRQNLQTWQITLDTTLSITDAAGNSINVTGTDQDKRDVYYIDFSFPGFQNATDEEIETKTIAFQWDPAVHTKWADAAVEAVQLAFKKRHNLDNKLVNVKKNSDTQIEIWAPVGGPWIQGLHDNKPNRIEISTPEIEVFSVAGLTSLPLENSSRVMPCGVATDVTSSGLHQVGNGKLTADLEYFCMGERGDQYRMMGWPNYVPTRYMIGQNVDSQTEFDYLDIHYYFQGEGVRSDKSEKVLTLVAVHDKTAQNLNNSPLKAIYDVLCDVADSDAVTTGDLGEYVDNEDVITEDANEVSEELDLTKDSNDDQNEPSNP